LSLRTANRLLLRIANNAATIAMSSEVPAVISAGTALFMVLTPASELRLRQYAVKRCRLAATGRRMEEP
jgi:hypothetical protein